MNFKGGSVGLDYNFKSGDYTANASYDAWDSKNDKHHAGFSVSAGKNGSASLDGYYNYGNKAIPPQLRGHGGTLSFSNDGTMSLSGQMQGATVGTLTYDTNTHGFQPISLNQNFQNEFNQGLAAENAQFNHSRSQLELVKPLIATGLKMGLYSSAEIDQFLPKDKDGNIDVDRANPNELLSKWNDYKGKMSGSDESVKIWKDQVSKAGEAAGLKINFNDGKSATSTFGKFVSGIAGDIAQSFGFANDGSKMVDKSGVFHLDTCFVAGTQVHLATGTKSIETLQIGDIVQSWNEKTNTFENKRVTELFVHEVPQLFDLELNDEETLHTTWNHPFRRRATANNDLATSEWVKVEDLRLNNQVLMSDGSWARVTGLFHYNVEPTKVYNIEVEDNHTYIVGESGVVVHNYTEKERTIVAAAMNRTEKYGKLAPDDAEFVGGLTELKKLDNEFRKNASESYKETNRLMFDDSSARMSLNSQIKKNNDFLTMLRSPEADSLPGIKSIREKLIGIKPGQGFTKSSLLDIDNWIRQDLSKNLPMGAAGLKDLGGGYASATPTFNSSPQFRSIGEVGTHVGLWKLGRELSSVEGLKASNLRFQSTQDALANHEKVSRERGVAEAKKIQEVEARIEGYVAKVYGDDPRFAERIVDSRTIDKSSLSKKTSSIDFETKRKAFDLYLSAADNAKIQEYDNQILGVIRTQKKLERQEYENHTKKHPDEPYKRSPELDRRREKALAMQDHLEKERSNFLNETVTNFPQEPRRIELEKLALKGSLSAKDQKELNEINIAKKEHNNEVAALFDQNKNKMHDSLERNFGGERGVVVKNRFEQTDKIQTLESKLATLDPKDSETAKERSDLQKQITKAEERVAQIDKNFLDYEPKRRMIHGKEEPLGDFVLRRQQSYEQEEDAIKAITKQLEARKETYEKLGDKKKAIEIDKKIVLYEKREMKTRELAKDDVFTLAAKEDQSLIAKGKPATEVAKWERYKTHKDGEGHITRSLPISDKEPGFKHPVGDDVNKNTITYTSHYGEEGYGFKDIVKSALKALDHSGIDIAAMYGDRVNTMLSGTVVDISQGLEIKVPSKKLESKGIIYLPEGLHTDGSVRKEGLYREGEKTPLSREELVTLDPGFKKEAYTGIRMTGVIYLAYNDDKKKGRIVTDPGFYTLSGPKDEIKLSERQVQLQIPPDAIDNPKTVNSGGNSVTIETKFEGEISGTFRLEYKHFKEDPRKWIEIKDFIPAGKQIGNVGSTGRSTGPHLHATVKYFTANNPPLELPKGLYTVKGEGKNQYYEINGDYFLNEIVPKGLKKRKWGA
ncbi:TIGR04388 family protein [Leptospira sp. 201903071]|nr:TIGR04388 family protein [Leptospira ainazelensis]